MAKSERIDPRRDAQYCEALDAQDPLRLFRDEYCLPSNVVYLDGNSLGALPKATAARVQQVVEREWGRDLITSWNTHGWIDMPQRVGAKIARIVGANPGEVIVADSTSVNLFKTLAAAVRLRPGRDVILSDEDNFPSDLYMVQGLAGLLGLRARTCKLTDLKEFRRAVTPDVAVVTLTHVNYRSGRMLDMAAITAAVHEGGALIVWDLAHSAGAVPLTVAAAGVDFAVGCGYKFLNGGPGAPAFVFVAQRHLDAALERPDQGHALQPLTGWMGHAQPFAFEAGYHPAAGMASFLCGTPPVISLAALEVGVDIALEADMGKVRGKAVEMGRLFEALMQQMCAQWGFVLASPVDPEDRGSQICFCHPEGYAIMQALIARGVIGDFRAPDILRFGFAPLYNSYTDVWTAVGSLRCVMDGEEWRLPEHQTRKAVT